MLAALPSHSTEGLKRPCVFSVDDNGRGGQTTQGEHSTFACGVGVPTELPAHIARTGSEMSWFLPFSTVTIISAESTRRRRS